MSARASALRFSRPNGQALVLAALMMLVITLAVLTTVNLGHTVHERVRLQNTADAAAYSMAAMEARAFNFYAFVNRAHVTHYVSAMVWQSLLSFTYFTEAFLVDLYGVMKTLDPCAGETSGLMGALCDVLRAVPVIGQIIAAISEIIGLFRAALKNLFLTMLRTVDPDRLIGREIVPMYREMNSVLTASARATLTATLSQVSSTSNDVVLENDRNIDLSQSRLLSGLLSRCMFERAHMNESWAGDPFAPLDPRAHLDSSKVARAKRAMGDVTNATRFALDRKNNPDSKAGPGWVTNRQLKDLIALPTYLQPLTSMLDAMPAWKWGQTRLLSHSDQRSRVAEHRRRAAGAWREPDSRLGGSSECPRRDAGAG